MRIAFLWDNGTHKLKLGEWDDGLWLALQYIRWDGHQVEVFEPRDKKRIDEFKPDVLLFWGALCENAKEVVVGYDYPKAICFAGGQIEASNVDGFDLYFYESDINADEFRRYGKHIIKAFGINELLFKPENKIKVYDAFNASAFAKWKRPELFAEVVGSKGCWVGQKQDHEKECYEYPEKLGVVIKDLQPRKEVCSLINQSYCVLNTANYWGGGQRLTLEAMACNIPPIVMSDSPKNVEYINDSMYGFIADPDVNDIKEKILLAKELNSTKGREFILSKYTGRHYADALLTGLKQL